MATRFRNLGVGLVAMVVCLAPYDRLKAALEDTWQPSQERAQDQPFPKGSPFALLPGFKIDRVTPDDKTESLIVITFDSLGRPVVSQSASGTGSSPRVLLDENKDGIFEAETIVSDKLNTCHGLFYDGTTLYANCRGVLPGDPDPPAAASGRAAAAGWWTWRQPAARRWNSWPVQAAGPRRRRRHEHDRAHPALHRRRNGRSRTSRDPQRTGRLRHVSGGQQHLRRCAAGQRRRRGYGELAELEQHQGTAVPSQLQRPAVREQRAHRRARDGVAAAAGQQVRALL